MPQTAPEVARDQRLEEILGNLLRAGVMLAGLVVAIGAVIYLARHGMEAPRYHRFRGAAPDLRSIPGVIAGVRELRGRSIIQLGLLLLIATPIARVAFSAVAFALQRDRLYVFMTLLVLAVLGFSLLGQH